MTKHNYDELLWMVTPIIEKEETVMRQTISANERLSVTLRYLATGNTFEDLKFVTAISPYQAMGRNIIETCEAIIILLEELHKGW